MCFLFFCVLFFVLGGGIFFCFLPRAGGDKRKPKRQPPPFKGPLKISDTQIFYIPAPLLLGSPPKLKLVSLLEGPLVSERRGNWATPAGWRRLDLNTGG